MTSMTSQELLGAVFSVLNSQLLAPTTAQALAANTQQPSVRLDQPHDGDGFVDGQTITVRALVAGTQGVPRVEFAVNGQSFGIDSTFPYELTFTIPSGVRGLTFDATVRDVVGTELTAVPVDVVVEPDPLTTITGRVVDESGNPVEGAVVDLLSEGLQAEFFDFARALATLPDLSGQTPDRITRVTALNLRDPNGIFGFDLFGTRLAPDYSARFSGWIAVATTGTHRFFLGTHEGARLKIGGITVVDISAGSGQYQEGSGSVDLAAGLTPIEVTYYEGVGNAQLQLSFVPPGGERQIVPPSSLVPGIEPYVATTDALGTFILRGVPTALASIRVRATITANNQDVSATSSAVTPVPPTGVNVEDIVIAKQQR
jgi:hypothetical protein